MILVYSEFSLDMFHYIVKIRQNKNPKQEKKETAGIISNMIILCLFSLIAKPGF